MPVFRGSDSLLTGPLYHLFQGFGAKRELLAIVVVLSH
jgi:hypothetical protein